MYNLDLEKAEEPEVRFQQSFTYRDSVGIPKKKKKQPIYFCFTDYAKPFDCMDHNKLWKILKQMRITSHLTSLFRNLYAGQEATVRTRHRTMDG